MTKISKFKGPPLSFFPRSGIFREPRKNERGGPLNFEILVVFEEGLLTEKLENRKSDYSIIPIIPLFRTFFREAVGPRSWNNPGSGEK